MSTDKKGIAFDAFSNLSSGAGAEPVPFGSYDLETDNDGTPIIVNGSLVDGKVVADRYPVDSETGLPQYADSSDKTGLTPAKKSVFVVAKDDATGARYKVKAGSLYQAIKASPRLAEYVVNGMLRSEGIAFQQTQTSEYLGRPVFTVQLEATKEKATA